MKRYTYILFSLIYCINATGQISHPFCSKLKNTNIIVQHSWYYDCAQFYFSNWTPVSQDTLTTLEEVIFFYKKYVSSQPLDPSVYSDLAWLGYSLWRAKIELGLEMSGEGFFQEFYQLKNLFPDESKVNGEYAYQLAIALESFFIYLPAETLESLIDLYQLAIKSGGLSNKRVIRIYLNMGHLYRKEGRLEEALIHYNHVLQIDPENRVVLKFLNIKK